MWAKPRRRKTNIPGEFVAIHGNLPAHENRSLERRFHEGQRHGAWRVEVSKVNVEDDEVVVCC